uniref:Polyprotein n=1 Tax=Guarapuava tymovirus-like 1 TaxID=2487752 RepID=A0A3G4YID7_9VIRU|nr:polyprotein [Guarapuava tymovirus-like 1]
MASNAPVPSFANALENLPQHLRDVVLTNQVPKQTAFLERADRLPLFLTPQPLHDELVAFGLPLTGLETETHPHAAHKNLELWFYQSTLASFARGAPTTCISMKESKVAKLNKKLGLSLAVKNPALTGRDRVRYSSPAGPAFPILTTPRAYLDYALMFYSPTDIAVVFHQNPALEDLLCTAIIPAETFHRLPSLYPHLYQIQYCGDQLLYTMESGANGAYQQPVHARDWLDVSHIQSGQLTLTVTLVESFRSHHVLLISRGRHVAEDRRVFDSPGLYELPPGSLYTAPLHSRLVPPRVYHAAFSYARSVRSLRDSDITAFIRTQRSHAEFAWVHPSAWDLLADFMKQTALLSPEIRYSFPSWLHTVKAWVSRHPWLVGVAAVAAGASTIAAVAAAIQALAPVVLPALVVGGLAALFFAAGWLLDRLRASRAQAYIAFLFERDFHLSFETHEIEVDAPVQRPTPAPRLRSARANFVLGGPALNSDVSAAFSSLAAEFSNEASAANMPPSQSKASSPPDVPVVPSPPSAGPATETPPAALEDDTPGPVGPSNPPSVEAPPPPETGGSPPPEPPPPQESDFPASSDSHPSHRPTPAASFTGVAGTVCQAVTEISGELPPARGRPPPPPVVDVTEFPDRKPAWEHLGLSQPELGLHFEFGARSTVCVLPIPERNTCLFDSVRKTVGHSLAAQWEALSILPDRLLANEETRADGFSTEHLAVLCHRLRFAAVVWDQERHLELRFGPSSEHVPQAHIIHEPGHFRPAKSGEISKLRRKNPEHPPPAPKPPPPLQPFRADPDRAKNLCRNMRSGCEGVMHDLDLPGFTGRDYLEHLDRLVDAAKASKHHREVTLEYISGVAGCGKSAPLAKRLLARSNQDFRVVVPTHNLRGEWFNELLQGRVRPNQVSTWEKGLLHHAQLVVLDELPKMPRGYLDLCILADPSVRKVIVLADPAQVEYFPLDPRSTNLRIESTSVVLRPHLRNYCITSQRIPARIARPLGIVSASGVEGFVRCKIPTTEDYAKGSIVLVNSHATAKTFAHNGVPCYTVAGSQGLTIRAPVFIQLTPTSRLLSANAQYVALTRSTVGVYFFGDVDMLENGDSLYRDVYSGVPKTLEQRFPILDRSTFSATLVGGAGVIRASAQMFGPSKLDPEYSSDVLRGETAQEASPERATTLHLPPSRLPFHQDLEIIRPSDAQPGGVAPTPTFVEPCLPRVDFRDLVTSFDSEAWDPSSKEITFRGVRSNQFPFLNAPRLLGAQALGTIAARHDERRDPTLLKASITKRLRFRRSAQPYRFSDRDHTLAHLLITSLASLYGRDPNKRVPFNPDLFARCIAENEFAQLTNKTQKVIMANAERSDPDWRWSVVRIFAKTQHKINAGTIFGPWKACQTLALMHDAVILLLGPVKKYQRLFDSEERPSNIYIHAGKTPSQLSAYCQQRLKSSRSTSNDYTAFDQSQHGEAVLLERWKMWRLSIPPALIQLHVWIKTNVTTQFGPLTCMRLTGEPGTYDDNSDYNLAVLGLRYNLSPSHTIFVSGDDSAIFPPPTEHPRWLHTEPLLHLRFKTVEQRHTLFCGYYLGPAGACRDPLALFAKLAVALDEDRLHEVLLSHLAEFSTGHRLGQPVFSLFPESLSLYHCACFQLFCQKCTPAQKLILRAPGTEIGSISKSITASSKLSQKAYQILRELDPNFTHNNFSDRPY